MALIQRKIEDRVDMYLLTAPKVEILVSPVWTNKIDAPLENSLQQYLEESPYARIIYTEFLIEDPSMLIKDDKTYQKVREICLRTISQLTTGCRFAVRFPNSLSLLDNITLARNWGDLFVGFCLDFDTTLQSKELAELQAAGVAIKSVVIQAKQLTKLSKGQFPVLPTKRILIQDVTALSDKELELICSEVLPADCQVCISIKSKELEQMNNKLHILFSSCICFYLSRESTDTEPSLSDMIRHLPITLHQADNLLQNGYNMASLSIYEESHFQDILRLTQQRYGVRTPPKRVAIFGIRSIDPEHKAYQDSRQIAAALASEGFQVVTGGYVGIMEAANKGALEAETKNVDATESLSEGVLCPTLFFSQIKGNDGLSKRYVKHGINQRTDKLVEDSSILIVMPGTIGTVTELMVGLGMSTIDTLYSLPGFPRIILACRLPWQNVMENAWKLLNAPTKQIENIIYFDTVEEAIELAQKEYERLLKATRH